MQSTWPLARSDYVTHVLEQKMFRRNFKFYLTAALYLLIANIAKAIPPPPSYIELNSTTIQKTGFKLDLFKRENRSHLALSYPSKIKNLHPHWADITVLGANNEILFQSNIPIDESARTIRYRYSYKVVDVSMIVTYCKRGGGGCKSYSISSLSKSQNN